MDSVRSANPDRPLWPGPDRNCPCISRRCDHDLRANKQLSLSATPRIASHISSTYPLPFSQSLQTRRQIDDCDLCPTIRRLHRHQSNCHSSRRHRPPTCSHRRLTSLPKRNFHFRSAMQMNYCSLHLHSTHLHWTSYPGPCPAIATAYGRPFSVERCPRSC